MGKDSGSWFHQQHLPWRSPHWKGTSPVPDLRQQNISEGNTYPYTYMGSANGSLPQFAVSQLPYLKTGQENELNGWFYCLSRHCQALTPNPNIVPNEKLSGDSLLNSVSGPVQNGFFAFDQSRYQTSLIFGSVTDSPVQRLIAENPKPFDTIGGSSVEDEATKRDLIYHSGNVISDGLDENQETGEEVSEFHEDTEELDALLYSEGDSDFDDNDDEVISTGHSPFEFTGYSTKQQEVEGNAEEVASSTSITKRKRLLNNEKDSLMDTASSLKPNASREYKDDAESSCVKGRRTQVEEIDSLPSNKRLKREKIRVAVRMLHSIIPGGGKGKDAIFVLDEAIRYLRSMKAQC